MVARALAALAKVCSEVREATQAEGVLGVPPRFVAAPGTVAEAAEVLRVAAERGLTVLPRGGETRLDWGAPPDGCDLLVDTARLDRVVEHADGDLIVKVEAGLPMERLAEVVAERGQELALDRPLPGSTVGGTLATAAAGPRRLLHGTPRDLLIGITVVRADGAVAHSGGKVVKNVAGYDLGKLFTGSYGTLGLIVEATFRLHPLTPARAYLTRELADASGLTALVRAVAHSAAVPSAVEVDAPPDRPVTVGVLVEGTAESVPARAAQLAGVLGAGTEEAAEPPPWWGGYPDGTTLVEISGPPADGLPELPGFAVRGSAASGHWYAAAGPEISLGDLVDALDRLRRTRCAPGRGSAVVRYAPEKVREAVDMWGALPALPLMRRVKDQFDPGHRLSPGRFAGGI